MQSLAAPLFLLIRTIVAYNGARHAWAAKELEASCPTNEERRGAEHGLYDFATGYTDHDAPGTVGCTLISWSGRVLLL